MSNAISIVRQGESFEFSFDLDGDSIDGWVCTINVKQFPSDTAFISRIVPPASGDQWDGFLTSTETAALATGLYRLTGVLTNATTDEEEQDPIRFNVAQAWG